MILERVRENFIEIKRSKCLSWSDFGPHCKSIEYFCNGSRKSISLSTYINTCQHLGYKSGTLMNKDLLKKG